MPNYVNRAWEYDVALGQVTGSFPIRVKGHLLSVKDAIREPLSVSPDVPFGNTPETLNIVSTSTNDDGNPVGTGARTILLIGVDSNNDPIEETVELNGTTNVLTSNTFSRLFSMEVLTVGNLESNVGAITAIGSSTVIEHALLPIGENVTRLGIHTVSAGREAISVDLGVNIGRTNKAGFVDVFVETRLEQSNSPWIERQVVRLSTTAQVSRDVQIRISDVLPEGTDVRLLYSASEDDINVDAVLTLVESAT
jgi:hypothetical protein